MLPFLIFSKILKRFGALDYKECIIEDVKPKFVTLTFPKMIQAKPGEAVWFSFITFKSRQHRDQVNKKVMSDPTMNDPSWSEKDMPVDMKRFYYGGFKVEVGV